MEGLRFDLDFRITELKNSMKESMNMQLMEVEKCIVDFENHVVKRTIPINITIQLALIVDLSREILIQGHGVKHIVVGEMNDESDYDCYVNYHKNLSQLLKRLNQLNDLIDNQT